MAKERQHVVFLGVGSNIEPEKNLPRALEELRNYGEIEAVSSVWESPAVGSPGPNFLNAAVKLSTALGQEELKQKALSRIEADLGRQRTEDKYAPRTIDLDILIFDGTLVDEEVWKIAHLAVPLAELSPDYRERPGGEELSQLSARLKDEQPIARYARELRWFAPRKASLK